MKQLSLDLGPVPAAYGLTAVHCIFGTCGHQVDAYDPQVAHDAMENHYSARHAAAIARIVNA